MAFVKKPETSKRKILNYIQELNEASLNNDINVTISLRVVKDEFYCDIVFFKGENCFSITMYDFYSVEKNDKIFKMACDLIKDSSKYDEFSKIKSYEI